MRLRLIFGAAVAVTLTAGAVVWLVSGDDDGEVVAVAGDQSDADTTATALHAEDQYCGSRAPVPS